MTNGRSLPHSLAFQLRMRLPPATRILFVVNIALFLVYWIGAGVFDTNLVVWLECHPPAVRSGMVWQLITYAFIHHHPMHLLGNMLFLWFLGPLVERRIGTSALFQVYFLAALLGGLLHFAIFFRSDVAMLGASGAVMGIAVIAAVYYFDLLIYFMGFFPIKLGVLISVILVIDALYLIGPSGSGVAHYAHLIGAAVGYGYTRAGALGWLDIWRWHWRRLAGRFPWRRNAGRRSARIHHIYDDEYFKK